MSPQCHTSRGRCGFGGQNVEIVLEDNASTEIVFGVKLCAFLRAFVLLDSKFTAAP